MVWLITIFHNRWIGCSLQYPIVKPGLLDQWLHMCLLPVQEKWAEMLG